MSPSLLTAMLERLGATKADVAENLAAGEHRGHPGIKGECPVCQYVRSLVGPDPIVNVGALFVSVDAVKVRHTPATGAFVNEFDAHPEMYEELVCVPEVVRL